MVDGNRAVVLLEFQGSLADYRSNLVAVDGFGRILWRASLPTDSANDAFTSVEVASEGISAFTWSCHRLFLDPDTGETLRDEFTK
jgi:hypothetical protein